ncbi:dipeptide ABC transporter ATP-binding protein [Microvirga zambiensis]|uniref:dipeptide ABC transporter ATP-binding protein n=1 Tax=Microvirga zambiensis TaxID=1402137 RepID=UPI00191D48B0|nr:ABC transporter ATP-binding protein [Microvirga zambiensis]
MLAITDVGRPTQPNLLQVADLNFWYDAHQARPETRALKDVGFSLERGAITAIVGESGSGKSTLINAILGLHSSRNHRLDARSLRFDDVDLTALSHRQWREIRGRRIGYIAQDASGSLNPLRRIGSQLEEVLVLHHPTLKRGTARKAALERLTHVGFDDPQRIFDSYPHQLSGGMNQRVAIAAALAGNPQLILADEPTSALDVSVQRQVLDHLTRAIKRSGVSLLLITHDLALAADRADRILVMKSGEIVENGPTRSVLSEPRHEYTKALIAAAPMLTDEVGTATTLSPAASPLLQVRDLSKTYGDRKGAAVSAFAKVSFDLHPRETLCIVGESGSGKTSLVRTLLQLTEADTGSVAFNGYAVGDLKGGDLKRFRRDAQMVYQNPYASLNSRHRISTILREPLAIHDIGTRSEQKEAARSLLSRVGLPESFLTRRPSQLSGGQRQRIAIARALITGPKLLVLDEAVSALDVSAQQAVLELLKELQESLGLTYLFITHNLAVARQFSDRVLVMREGRIVEHGATAQIFTSPQHPYTRQLLEAAPGFEASALVHGHH